MRVGLVIYGSLDTLSGGYLYDRTLLTYLRDWGDEVEIFSQSWRDYARHLGDNLSHSFLKRLQQARLNVLLQDELNHQSLVWLNRRLLSSTRYPLISIVHHLRCSEMRPAWQNYFYRTVETAYLTTVSGFIYNSQTTRAATEHLVGTQKPHVVAPPGENRFNPHISDEQILARTQREGPLQVLFVGNVIPRKGLHTLLSALARLPDQTWKLTVAGNTDIDPGYITGIRHQVQLFKNSHRIEFRGILSDTSLSELLARSDILVVPSSYEGFGIVYLEGMGFGLPAIATTAGGAVEIIHDGENGYLIPHDDPTTLAERLRLLQQDRRQLAAMSLSARSQYEQQPMWNDSCRRIRGFLQQIVS